MTEPMSSDRIVEIRLRAAKARRPGWKWVAQIWRVATSHHVSIEHENGLGKATLCEIKSRTGTGMELAEAETRFVAAAYDDVPDLVDEILRLKNLLADAAREIEPDMTVSEAETLSRRLLAEAAR